jgi:hypothetical protein
MIRLFALALLAAGQPGAAPAPPPAAAQGLSQDVPTVTVTARKPVVVTASQACPEPDPARYPAASDPRVIDSFPRNGGAAAPGLVQVRVTFDAPMSCYAEVTSQGGDQDPCEPRGAWSIPDRRSFLLRCRLAPGVAYVFDFRRDTGRGFVGMSGRDADPFVLRFSTASGAAPMVSWPQALAADPGPPGVARPRGYVTCTDVPPAERNGDCSRQGLDPPAPPPP